MIRNALLAAAIVITLAGCQHYSKKSANYAPYDSLTHLQQDVAEGTED